MEESGRIQQIMEVEEATDPEARFLYHLEQAREAWREVKDVERGEQGGHDLPATMQFNTNYRNLWQMMYAEIHLRNHPDEAKDS